MIISLFQQSGGGGSSGDKIGIAPPTISSTGLTYDGTAKSPVIGPYNEDAVAISYTPHVNAGTYSCTIALRDKSKYVWLDTYDTDNKMANWTVAKASGSSSLSKYAVELEEGGSDNVTVTRAGDGEIIATSSDTAVATVSVSGTTVTIFDGGTEGTATVSISVAAGTNYNAVGAKSVTVEVTHAVQIVTWADGTDAQITKMCAASDEGMLNLYDYWNVGDKRTVSLSAMEATGVGESHRAQNVVMVIVNKGGYEITNGLINAFVVQQESCLASTDSGTNSDSELGYMNSSYTNSGSWSGCARRTWCNNVYKNALPSTLRNIFKEVIVTTAKTYNGTTNQISSDYFFLPAAAEVFKGDSSWGTGNTAGQYTAYSNLTEFNALSRWQYYETTGNRGKKIGTSGALYRWWVRSPSYNSNSSFCDVANDGSADTRNANYTWGLAPAGCIGTVNNGSGVVIPTWSSGSVAQIVDAVNAADAGEVDLTDYWNVGDKRTVSLSAMEATGVGESHRAQNVVLVLVAKDKKTAAVSNPCYNYTYVTAKAGRSYPSFIVQQENCLSSTDSGTPSDSERGYMNSTNTNSGSWDSCARRTWCNSIYRNAIPSTLRSIFKHVKVKTIKAYNGSAIRTSSDYFFLPAAAEVFKGDATYGAGGTAGQKTAQSNLTEFKDLSRWQYYETTTNRVKKMGLSGAANTWWERSPHYNSATSFCAVINNGNASSGGASSAGGLAPCGCI